MVHIANRTECPPPAPNIPLKRIYSKDRLRRGRNAKFEITTKRRINTSNRRFASTEKEKKRAQREE
jgi:hypothetical protein